MLDPKRLLFNIVNVVVVVRGFKLISCPSITRYDVVLDIPNGRRERPVFPRPARFDRH